MNQTFGNTGLKTSPIVYGCMGGAGAFGAQEETDSIEALRADVIEIRDALQAASSAAN